MGDVPHRQVVGTEDHVGCEIGDRHLGRGHEPKVAALDPERVLEAGGIEGGMTNGAAVVARVAVKPVATLRKPLDSVDLPAGSLPRILPLFGLPVLRSRDLTLERLKRLRDAGLGASS